MTSRCYGGICVAQALGSPTGASPGGVEVLLPVPKRLSGGNKHRQECRCHRLFVISASICPTGSCLGITVKECIPGEVRRFVRVLDSPRFLYPLLFSSF